jgi:predicted outer membrane repeat protein
MSRGRLLLGFACMLLVFSAVQADTTYVNSLTITSPTTWAASGNPYIIRGGVRIQNTLTIEPGVKIYFDSNIMPRPGILVESSGSIIAIGNSTDSISFSPTDTSQRCGHLKISGEVQFTYCRFTYLFTSSIFNPGYGGALDFMDYYGNSKISHCYFGYNQAPEVGGAINTMAQHSAEPLEISDCCFEGNFSDLGGGAISLETNAVIERCTFILNHTGVPNMVWGAGMGGAIALAYGQADVSYNIFIQNSARDGGAIASGSTCVYNLNNNLYYNNFARISGGAACFQLGTINSANETFIGNVAESLGYVFSDINNYRTISNCIIRQNSTPQLPSILNVIYSNIEGGYPGTGNIDIDPQFVNAGAGNFHLTCSSPCIDAGDPASPLDPDYTRADMGAYYYHHMNGSGDANYDCQVMGADVTYLVRYFKGIGAAPYPLWRGDASGDTIVAGADVVYLVRYLKGLGNPPVKNPNCSHPDWSIPDSCNPCGY